MKLIPGVFLQDKNILVNTLFTFFKCISKISHRISKFKGASNESISALKKAFRRRPFNKLYYAKHYKSKHYKYSAAKHFPYTKDFMLCKGEK